LLQRVRANAGMKFLLSSVLALVALTSFQSVHAASEIPDESKTGGFAIGCQAYSFNRYSVFEAIEKTAEVGAKVIEFYPGQKLSKEEPELKWDHNSAPGVVEKVKAKLKQHHVLPVAYGVVGLSKDEAASRKVFEFAKTMGIRVINTESVEALDTFEKLAKEYDIKVGFHNHPKKPNNADYKVWDPNYILSLVKDRDSRIGACADTGHWQRSGLKPVDCLQILKGRIVSSHLKDLTEMNSKGHDVPYGTGIGDIKGTLDEFKAQGFSGPISVEYEHNWETSVPEVKQCIDFVRNYGGKN
jgi:sugar phosphate isomerase/epimerase